MHLSTAFQEGYILTFKPIVDSRVKKHFAKFILCLCNQYFLRLNKMKGLCYNLLIVFIFQGKPEDANITLIGQH